MSVYLKVMSYLKSENGQGMVEYGLILALVAVVAIATMTSLGSSITTKLQSAANALK